MLIKNHVPWQMLYSNFNIFYLFYIKTTSDILHGNSIFDKKWIFFQIFLYEFNVGVFLWTLAKNKLEEFSTNQKGKKKVEVDI